MRLVTIAALVLLVGHSDAQVQALAIECLCKWQQPALTAHGPTPCCSLRKENSAPSTERFRSTIFARLP